MLFEITLSLVALVVAAGTWALFLSLPGQTVVTLLSLAAGLPAIVLAAGYASRPRTHSRPFFVAFGVIVVGLALFGRIHESAPLAQNLGLLSVAALGAQFASIVWRDTDPAEPTSPPSPPP